MTTFPLARCSAVALLVLTSASTTHAWSRTGGVWRTLPVGWRWNPDTVPSSLGSPDNARVALEAAFATWASAPCTSFRAVNLGTTTVVRGNSRDRSNTLSWISGAWPPELGAVNSVIGVTLPVSSGGANLDADIMFNAVGFTWSLDGRRGTVDTQSIAVHEQGHFLGLGHSTTPPQSIMYPAYPGRPSRVMSSDDIQGVCSLYPGAGTPSDGGVLDAATPADPCNAITSCGECTPQATCGWCDGLRRCMTGVVAGPTLAACPSGWAPFPSNCSTAPADAGSAGTTGFGGPCRSATDCASGGPCISVSMGPPFCTQRCIDDCTCPRDYRCVQLRADLALCVQGTNTCTPDAGPTLDAAAPPRDVSPSPDLPSPFDATQTPSHDASSSLDAVVADALVFDDIGAVDDVLFPDVARDAQESPVFVAELGGCGCRTSTAPRAPMSAMWIAVVWALQRRRARRKQTQCKDVIARDAMTWKPART